MATVTRKFTSRSQLIKLSGSCALNDGEAQGTVTDRDFVNKGPIILKELKESRNNLKVLAYIKAGDTSKKDWLFKKSDELIKIMNTMILNNKDK